MNSLASPTAELRAQPRARPWHRIWLSAALRPTTANFRRLLAEPNVGFRKALQWISLASLAGGLLSWAISPGFCSYEATSGDILWSAALNFSVLAGGILMFAVTVPALHMLARALGGQGSFGQLAYLAAAYCSVFVLLGGAVNGIDTALLTAGSPSTRMSEGVNLMVAQPPTGWLWVAGTLCLSLLRVGFDAVALQTVYGLSRAESRLVAAVPLTLFACGICALLFGLRLS